MDLTLNVFAGRIAYTDNFIQIRKSPKISIFERMAGYDYETSTVRNDYYPPIKRIIKNAAKQNCQALIFLIFVNF